MYWLRRKIIRWLKIRTWGVAWQRDLPPEFIITKHAEQRLEERVPELDPEKACMRAWEEGTSAADWFKKYVRFHKSGKKRSYRYKSWRGYVFVYGIHYNKLVGYGQKYLITIYVKNKYGD